MAQIIQFRRDSSTNWTGSNPILAQGEIGVQLDDYRSKIGDGINGWNALSFFATGGSVDWAVSTVSGTDVAITTGAATNTLYYPKYLTTYTPGAGGGEWSVSTVSGTDLVVSTATDTNTIYYPKWLTTAQGSGAYLTTAMQSDAGSLFQSTGAYLTTAAQSGHTHSDLYIPLAGSSAYQTATLASTFLTTAAASGHSHGNPTLSLVNLSGATSSASNGLTVSLTGPVHGGIYFIDSNGHSWVSSVGTGTDSTGASYSLNTSIYISI